MQKHANPYKSEPRRLGGRSTEDTLVTSTGPAVQPVVCAADNSSYTYAFLGMFAKTVAVVALFIAALRLSKAYFQRLRAEEEQVTPLPCMPVMYSSCMHIWWSVTIMNIVIRCMSREEICFLRIYRYKPQFHIAMSGWQYTRCGHLNWYVGLSRANVQFRCSMIHWIR